MKIKKGLNKQRNMEIDYQYQDFKTDGLIENKETPFYCKNVAIIGHLDNFDAANDIQELAFLLWEHGAAVSSHVTLSTDIVINGIDADEEDMRLINEMKEKGSSIIVYYQEDFEYMLSEYHLLDWYSGGISANEKKKSGKEYPSSIEIHIDKDLRSYLFDRDDVEKFVNFCIRERKNVIEKNYKKNFTPSEEAKDKSYVDPAYRKFLPDEAIENKSTIFYHKNIVITGTLSNYEYRNDLAALLHSFGAAINSNVIDRTDCVILGKGAGPKKKEDIKERIASGQSIRVIDESELILIFRNLSH